MGNVKVQRCPTEIEEGKWFFKWFFNGRQLRANPWSKETNYRCLTVDTEDDNNVIMAQCASPGAADPDHLPQWYFAAPSASRSLLDEGEDTISSRDAVKVKMLQSQLELLDGNTDGVVDETEAI